MSFINRWMCCPVIVVWTCLLSGCGGTDDGTTHAYAYVATMDALSTYAISPSSGELTAPVGSLLTFPTSRPFGGISGISTDPFENFLYVLDYSGIYAYAIDRNTGILTAVSGSPFEAGSIPTSLAFDASGNYLYVAGYSGPIAPVNGVISTFSLDSTGAPVPLAKYILSSPDLQSSALNTIAVAGNYLYVAGYSSNSITAFFIASTGELLPIVPGSPFTTDTGPFGIVADPSGSVLYTANAGAPTANDPTPGSISAFTIDSSTGTLTPVPGNPQRIAVQAALSIDPMGKFLFVPEVSAVSVYAIDTTTGALAAVAGSPFPTGTNPGVVSVDRRDRFAYVVSYGSARVSEFALESTGALTPVADSPVPVGSGGPVAIVGQ